MSRSIPSRISGALAAVIVLIVGCAPAVPSSTRYADLVALFEEWRTFERPAFVDGVPDYSGAAMSEQHRRLAEYQRRLDAHP